jgi:hypothetical protein
VQHVAYVTLGVCSFLGAIAIGNRTRLRIAEHAAKRDGRR